MEGGTPSEYRSDWVVTRKLLMAVCHIFITAASTAWLIKGANRYTKSELEAIATSRSLN